MTKLLIFVHEIAKIEWQDAIWVISKQIEVIWIEINRIIYDTQIPLLRLRSNQLIEMVLAANQYFWN